MIRDLNRLMRIIGVLKSKFTGCESQPTEEQIKAKLKTTRSQPLNWPDRLKSDIQLQQLCLHDRHRPRQTHFELNNRAK